MRIKSIELSWFRGAAEPVALDSKCRSMVVYGSNGSGKSSYVDAVEYVLKNGKIEHLAHEYSGRKGENSIPNTHRLRDQTTSLAFTFKDGSQHITTIKQNGSVSSTPSTTVDMQDWEYRRTVLRQHEVAEFIHSTKGEKYSALLPLLGLRPLETAAQNLHKLMQAIKEVSKIDVSKNKLSQIEVRRKEVFDNDIDDVILEKIKTLYKKYCVTESIASNPLKQCKAIKDTVGARMSSLSMEDRKYVALKSVAEIDLKSQIKAIRTSNFKLTDGLEPLITEKLEVLQSTKLYVDKYPDTAESGELECPACGQAIPLEDFKVHLKQEQERLKEIKKDFNTRKTAVNNFCMSIQTLQKTLAKSEVKVWRDESAKAQLASGFEHLDKIDVEKLRSACNEEDLQMAEDRLLPIIDTTIEAAKVAPPSVQELSETQKMVEAAIMILEGTDLAAKIKRIEALIQFVSSLEQGVRNEIHHQAEKVTEDISTDVQNMWGILHPGEPVENVRLYIPEGVNKAIDVGLRFYGVDQDSPRLTLSEGHRNSLGLCIFLAMAMRENETDKPIILDDVVVSFDREHRGMIAEVLMTYFNERQVIILTHDRDWFTDLKHQLDQSKWVFKTLLPYDTPCVGIRWSQKTAAFDDAKSLLKNRPDAAGNDARKIMDVELRAIAENLQIKLPFLRGDKNDRRNGYEFLQAIRSAGKEAFSKRDSPDDEYEKHLEALESLKEAKELLVTWGNRASHTPDISLSEANKLIDICEAALGVFKCANCNKFIWSTKTHNQKYSQCGCGNLRWRHGKS